MIGASREAQRTALMHGKLEASKIGMRRFTGSRRAVPHLTNKGTGAHAFSGSI